MKLLDVLKTVGGAVLKNAVPAGGLIVDLVNGFLPEDNKLPSDATGDQISSAVDALPPDKRAEVLSKEIDVEITQIKESNSTLRTMLQEDSKNPHTTRPWAIKQIVTLLVFVTIVVVSIWAIGVLRGDVEMVNTVMDGWPWVASVTAPFVTVLWAYFGILKTEHKNKLAAAAGSPIGKVATLISSFVKR